MRIKTQCTVKRCYFLVVSFKVFNLLKLSFQIIIESYDLSTQLKRMGNESFPSKFKISLLIKYCLFIILTNTEIFICSVVTAIKANRNFKCQHIHILHREWQLQFKILQPSYCILNLYMLFNQEH